MEVGSWKEARERERLKWKWKCIYYNYDVDIKLRASMFIVMAINMVEKEKSSDRKR